MKLTGCVLRHSDKATVEYPILLYHWWSMGSCKIDCDCTTIDYMSAT